MSDETSVEKHKKQQEEEEEDENGQTESKRIKTENKDSLESDVLEFAEWCRKMNIIINDKKVKLSKNSTSHNFGMVAVDDIDADEVLTRIPKSSCLEPRTTEIRELIAKNTKALKSPSNWSKLIITLMYELSNPNTKWSTYLKLFPDQERFDLPMFWDKKDLDKWLQYTCIPKNVEHDLENMTDEFENVIVPFLNKNMNLFNEKCLNFDYYKRIAGFIMSYSFRDSKENLKDPNSVGPMMVPVADALNHIAKNNAHIQFEKDELLICATKPIKKGEEVFNTYGDHSNADLLHMYGFVEAYGENIYDSVELPTKILVDVFASNCEDESDIVKQKLSTLLDIELIDDNSSIVIDLDGVLNQEETLHILQIFSMNSDEFKEFVDNDCELLEDEEWDNYSLKNNDLKKLPIDWLELLKECTQTHVEHLERCLEEVKTDSNDGKFAAHRRSLVERLLNSHLFILKNFLSYL